jgi:ABC-type lipoprotein release transport system permease subunit
MEKYVSSEGGIARHRPTKAIGEQRVYDRGVSSRTRASLGLLLLVAARSLLVSRLTAALMIAAVAAGGAFQIANSANLIGYHEALVEEGLVVSFGDVRVRPASGALFDDGDALARDLARLPGVRAAVACLVFPGAVTFHGRVTGAPLIAIDRAAAARPFRLTRGALPDPGDATSLVIGSSLAARLGVDVGDTLGFSALLDAAGAVARNMRVSGIAGGAFGPHESMYVDRAFLAAELEKPHGASLVLLYTDDHGAEAGAALARAASAAHPEAQARGWAEDSAYLGSAFGSVRAVGRISQAMVLLAVAIPVLALLYIGMLQRRKDAGILAAIGLSRREVFQIFLLQALLVALVGGALGALGGAGLIRWFQHHPIYESEGFVIRPQLALDGFVRPLAVVLAATLLAGVYPAWRAARVDPARVLKGIE